ncbi:MAG: hypothetical protein CVV27_02840 [Candidatus Melainabacteria bacterium HGW-Melainabacteria-1]|nr:MAG: hypothetical protein CVV27_02840 [Candidatus Melainabacteria bacterium HGW-Melainabacteria-1]
MYLILKILLSALLIALVSEVSRRSPSMGGLIASLPLLSVVAMIWLWRETHDTELIAQHALATFWYVLPSLPMFLCLPWLLRKGQSFPMALGASCLVTLGLYGLMRWLLQRLGIAF